MSVVGTVSEGIWGTISGDPRISKSNWLHVDLYSKIYFMES